MKIFSMTLAAIVTLVAANSTVQAQESAGGLVAVLDVAKIFKEHATFKGEMESLKQEVEAFDAGMKNEAAKLRTEMESLTRDVAPTSPQFKEGQAELARKDADMKIKANQKRQEILDREAKLYLTTYSEIQTAVAKICGEYGITLVLRYDSSPIDPLDRAQVIKGVNRPIIYQNQLDLTSMVMQKVSPQTASTGANLK